MEAGTIARLELLPHYCCCTVVTAAQATQYSSFRHAVTVARCGCDSWQLSQRQRAQVCRRRTRGSSGSGRFTQTLYPSKSLICFWHTFTCLSGHDLSSPNIMIHCSIHSATPRRFKLAHTGRPIHGPSWHASSHLRVASRPPPTAELQ